MQAVEDIMKIFQSLTLAVGIFALTGMAEESSLPFPGVLFLLLSFPFLFASLVKVFFKAALMTCK